MRSGVHDVMRSSVHEVTRLHTDCPDWRFPQPLLAKLTGSWHTGHDRDALSLCLAHGLAICIACASPEALAASTPLILGTDGRK